MFEIYFSLTCVINVNQTPNLKKLSLKYNWFHLKLYLIYQDLSRRSIQTGFWRFFYTRLKFIKFGHRTHQGEMRPVSSIGI